MNLNALVMKKKKQIGTFNNKKLSSTSRKLALGGYCSVIEGKYKLKN